MAPRMGSRSAGGSESAGSSRSVRGWGRRGGVAGVEIFGRGDHFAPGCDGDRDEARQRGAAALTQRQEADVAGGEFIESEPETGPEAA